MIARTLTQHLSRKGFDIHDKQVAANIEECDFYITQKYIFEAQECKEDFEDALNNLFEVVKAEVIKEAAFFLESEPKVFNAWYRKNINPKMKRID